MAAWKEGKAGLLFALPKNSAAVDAIGAAPEGGQQAQVVVRIVFQIGVLNQDVFSDRFAYAALHRVAFSPIARLGEHANARKGARDLAGAVGGAVIDNDDLFRESERFSLDGENPPQQLANERRLVVGRYDDGKQRHARPNTLSIFETVNSPTGLARIASIGIARSGRRC